MRTHQKPDYEDQKEDANLSNVFDGIPAVESDASREPASQLTSHHNSGTCLPERPDDGDVALDPMLQRPGVGRMPQSRGRVGSWCEGCCERRNRKRNLKVMTVAMERISAMMRGLPSLLDPLNSVVRTLKSCGRRRRRKQGGREESEPGRSQPPRRHLDTKVRDRKSVV